MKVVSWPRKELEPCFSNRDQIICSTFSIERSDVGLVNEGSIPIDKGRVYKMANNSCYLLDDPRIWWE